MLRVQRPLLATTLSSHTSHCPHHATFPIYRAAQLGEEADQPGSNTTALGRKCSCSIVQWLWYFNWLDGFPVAVAHALLHNVFGSFLAFALRKPADGDYPGTIVTPEGRRSIAELGRHVIPTSDIGRAYKCVLKHLGLYTFEDYKNLALVYGQYVLRPALPTALQQMYDDLVIAIRHYLTFGEYTAAAHTAAAAALRRYAGAVEAEPAMVKMLTPSLHVLVCRCAVGDGSGGSCVHMYNCLRWPADRFHWHVTCLHQL